MAINRADIDAFLGSPAPASKPTTTNPAIDEFLGPPPAEEYGVGGVAKDFAASFGVGANALLGLGGTLWGLGPGEVDNWATQQAERGRQYWQDFKSDTLKQAEQARKARIDAADGELSKAGVAIWETLKNPLLLGSFMAEQLPMLTPVGAAGRVAGGAVGARALAKGATQAAATKLARRAATGTAVGAGGVMQGADAGNQAYEQLKKIPDVMWAENEDVQDLMAKGQSFEKAVDTVAKSLARDTFLASAAISIATNLIPGAMVVEKALSGVKVPGGSRLINAARGLVGEALHGGTEEGTGAALANLATAQVDPNQRITEGVGEATGLGLTAGIFGAAAGVTEGGAAESGPPTVDQDVRDVSDAATTVLDSPDVATAAQTLQDQVNVQAGIISSRRGAQTAPEATDPGAALDTQQRMNLEEQVLGRTREAPTLDTARPMVAGDLDVSGLQVVASESKTATGPATENPAQHAVDALNELNPQLNGALRIEILSEDEMSSRATRGGYISRAGQNGAVINLREDASPSEALEEVRHMVDLLLGNRELSRWIDEDSKVGAQVKSFLRARYEAGDLAPGANFFNAQEVAQALLDQYFRNPELVKDSLPDLFEFLELMGAGKYRGALQPLYDALAATAETSDAAVVPTPADQQPAASGLEALSDDDLINAADYSGMDPIWMPLSRLSQEGRDAVQSAGLVQMAESEDGTQFEAVPMDAMFAERERRFQAQRAARAQRTQAPEQALQTLAQPEAVAAETEVQPAPATAEVTRGRDEKYGVDVELKKTGDASYSLTETDDSGAKTTNLEANPLGIWDGKYVMNEEGDFVDPIQINRAAHEKDPARRAFLAKDKEQSNALMALVAEWRFASATGDQAKAGTLQEKIYDIVFGKADAEIRAALGLPAETEVLVKPTAEREQRFQAQRAARAQRTQALEQPQYDYASSQVRLDEQTALMTQRAATNGIAAEDLNEAEGGIETEPHITIKYGYDEADQAKVEQILASQREPITAKVEGIEIFQPEGKDYDVVVQRVSSPQLDALRKKIEAEVEAPGDSFPEYKPHITLAYVNRGTGEKYANMATGLEGQTITFQGGEITNRAGEPIEVPFGDEEVLPEKLMDVRLKRRDFRRVLQAKASELVEGGGGMGALIENEPRQGPIEVVGAVASANPQWWQELTKVDGYQMSVRDFQNAVKKALAGERLGVRQKRMVQAVLDDISNERLQGDQMRYGPSVPSPVDEARAELARRRAERRSTGMEPGTAPPQAVIDQLDDFYAGLGETYEEDTYAPDMDFETRALFDLAQELEQAGVDPEPLLNQQKDEPIESTLDAFEAALEKAYGQQQGEQQGEQQDSGGAGQEAAPEAEVQQAETETPAGEADLAGPVDTTAQAISDQERAKDTARNEGETDMTGTLFGQDRNQADLLDQVRPSVTREERDAIEKHGLPEDTGFHRDGRGLVKGKVRASAEGVDTNYHDTVDEAARELADFLEAARSGRERAASVKAGMDAVEQKLRAGENPSFKEWQQAFPQLREGHTYLRQPDISGFLVDRFGFSRNRIRQGLGDASGTLTSDTGAEYPIVYFNKLAAVLSKQKRAKDFGTDEPETAKPAEPSASSPAEKIEDFGEKIGGAAKDRWTRVMQEDLPEEDAQITLSKHFPEPDYAKMIEAGMAPESLAMVKAMRDEIPAKPRSAWKLRRWAGQVRVLRGFAADIMDGTITIDTIRSKIEAEFPMLRTILTRQQLYMDLGFPEFTDLKGYEAKLAHYSLWRGEKDVYKWELRPSSASKSLGGLRGVEYFDADNGTPETSAVTRAGYQQLVARLREILTQAKEGGTERKTSLDLYHKRGEEGAWIGKKVAAGKFIDLKYLPSVAEARAYLKAHEDELLAELEKRKRVPNERREVNETRIGTDWRDGKDVTPESFQEAFGFRGVEFGNWVEQGRRQADLNNAYDALHDLAALLGINTKALSLNGELAMAFGARGKGGVHPASAHYESDRVVINLTKKAGPGSLAHEWFHALDNYFSRMRSQRSGFISDLPRKRLNRDGTIADPVREEVLEAWAGVMKAINQSKMVERSKELDKLRTKDYWSTPIELSARAFERWIIDKAAGLDKANDYLANIVGEQTWESMESMFGNSEPSYPYPTEAEAQEIGKAYQKLFDTIEEKKTDGGIALFSVASLPMDQASRKQRAEAQGWDTSTTWFHWTDSEFDAFSADGNEGVHLGTAQAAADRARGMDGIGYDIEQDNADGTFWVYPDGGPMQGDGIGPFDSLSAAQSKVRSLPKRIKPMRVYVRRGKYIRVDDLGTWAPWAILKALPEGTVSGAEMDAVMESDDRYGAMRDLLLGKGIRGLIYQNEVEDVGSDSILVFDPSDIRSVSAAFDPARKFENGLQFSISIGDPTKPVGEYRLLDHPRGWDQVDGGGTAYRGMTSAAVSEAIEPMLQAIHEKAGVTVRVVHSNELPQAIQEQIPAGKIPKGVLLGDTAYLVHDGLRDARDAVRILAHEVVGHYGVNQIVGDDWPSLVANYRRLKALGGKRFDEVYNLLKARYSSVNVDETTEVKEFIAHAAELRVQQGPIAAFLTRVRIALQKGLRALGFARMFSMTDIDALLAASTRYVMTGELNGFGASPGWVAQFAEAWHGTPYDVDRFSLQKIGTGEGAQAYGWGLYFSSMRAVAEWYRDQLTPRNRKWSVPGGADYTSAYDAVEDAMERAGFEFRDDYDTADASFDDYSGQLFYSAWLGQQMQYHGETLESIKKHARNMQLDEWLDPEMETIFAGRSEDEFRKISGFGHADFKEGVRRGFNRIDRIVTKILNDVGPITPIDGKKGNLYQVEVPDQEHLLNYDDSMAEQQAVLDVIPADDQERLEEMLDENGYAADLTALSGNELYQLIGKAISEDYIDYMPADDNYDNLPKLASEYLLKRGIKGLTYRGRTSGEQNYVIWDEDAIQIKAQFALDDGVMDDLFPAERKDLADAVFAVKVENEVQREIGIPFERILEPEQALAAFQPFTRYAQENLVAIVTDETGKVLQVLRHSIGGIDSAGMDTAVMMGSIMDVEGAKHVWMAHNHPSGGPGQSNADKALTTALKRAFTDTGIELEGMVVGIHEDGTGSWLQAGEQNDVSIYAANEDREFKVPVTERAFTSVNRMNPITGTQSALQFVKNHLNSRSGILFLDTRNNPAGFVPMTAEEMRNIRRDERKRAIYQAFHRSNARSVIPISSDLQAISNIARFVGQDANGSRVLDGVLVSDGGYLVSLADQGHSAIREQGPYFALEDEYTPEQAAMIRRISATAEPRSKRFEWRFEEFRQNAKTKFRQYWVDSYASIREILDDPRTWMLAQLTKSSWGAVEAGLKHGQPYLHRDGVIQIDTKKASLREILAPLGNDLDRFLWWVAANRAERLTQEERENLFTEDDIRIGKALNQDGSPGQAGYREGRERLFRDVNRQFEAFGHAIVKIAVDTGLVNAEEAAVWEEQGFYVPFYRVLSEEKDARGPRGMGNSGLVKQQAFKRLKGGTDKLGDLLANTMLNWNHLIEASLKNQTARAALAKAEAMGLAAPISAADAGKKAVYVRVDGKPQWWELDESSEGQLVLNSLMALNWEGFQGRFMQAARAMKRYFTTGVTASPEFKVANLVRDTMQAVAVAKMSPNAFANLMAGWKATRKDSEATIQAMASGGIFPHSGYIHGADPDAIRHMVKAGIEHETILDQRWKIKKIWDEYQDFGARLENVNRAANYVQALEAGRDRLSAAFEARDHVDFSRHGSGQVARFLTQTVGFLNARIQGLDKLGRAAMDPQQRAQFWSVVAAYSIASVLLYLGMRDDEDYKNAEEWERDAYHLFKLPGGDTMYRLPRPFELGAIANMIERMAEQLVDDEVHGSLFAERLWQTLVHTFSFNPFPQLVFPALEVWGNENTFTQRPIESEGMQNLSPKERKRAWTSETAIGLSRAMDSITWGNVVLSPVQIEHLVQGYLGWAGATTLAAFDMLVTRPVTGAADRPEVPLSQYPVIKRFVKTMPPRNTKYTTLFYENLEEINQIYADIGQYRKLRQMDEAKRMMRENQDKLRVRRMLNRQRDVLTKINNQMTLIALDPEMTPAQKRARMDELQIKKNAITERAVQAAEKAGAI